MPTLRRPERKAAFHSTRQTIAAAPREKPCVFHRTKSRCPPDVSHPRSQTAPRSRAGSRCNDSRSTAPAWPAACNARHRINTRLRSASSFFDDRMKPQVSWRLRQFHPATAPAIRFRVGETPDTCPVEKFARKPHAPLASSRSRSARAPRFLAECAAVAAPAPQSSWS